MGCEGVWELEDVDGAWTVWLSVPFFSALHCPALPCFPAYADANNADDDDGVPQGALISLRTIACLETSLCQIRSMHKQSQSGL